MKGSTEKPRIDLQLTPLAVIMEGLSFAGLIFLWIYAVVSYQKLPEQIPVHYNFKGEVDGVGNKATIFIVPAIITIVTVLLTMINKVPHIFNYPVNITAANAEQQYILVTSLLRYLKLVIVLLGIYITITTIGDATSGSSSMGYWFIPVLLVLIIGPTIYYISKANKT